MPLPNISITLGNGNLNQTTQTADGVCGLIITGASVPGKITLGEAYSLKSLKNAENLGISKEGTNGFAWKQVFDFYAQAKTGATLWLMLVPDTVSMEQMADITGDFSDVLLKKAKGAIRLLGFSRLSSGASTTSNGLDEDVEKTVPKAQELGEEYFKRYRPVRFIIDGKDFSGIPSELKNWKEDNKNRVSVLLANNDGSKNSSIGLLLGCLAVSPVQRNPGRVKDGQVEEFNAYFTNGEAVELLEEQWDDINDKGYIFLRSHVGRAGYYFTNAPTLTADTDDYKTIPRGRVIDKAAVLAYEVFVAELLEEIPTDTSGKIHPAVIKSFEKTLENTINQQMVSGGEISAVRCSINANQDILGTSTMNILIQIQPVGYAEFINIELGFTTNIENNE